MKRILKAGLLALGMLVTGAIQNKSSAQVSFSVSFQTFYDDLSPYGAWIYYPRYGYVWQPDEIYSGFRPYQSGGHWVLSEEYGGVWYSDYEWGWAAFHYGRWFYDSYYGWLWVPHYEWAPAWVVWRSGGGYYGWAPMSPGISIGVYFGSYVPPYNYWCFASRQYIVSPHISNYVLSIQQNTTIINNTTVINRYNRTDNVFVTGPSRTDAELYTGSKIQPVTIRESGRPGRMRERKNELTLYRPQIQKEKTGSIAPRKYDQYNRNERNEPVEKRNINNYERRNRDNKEIRRKDYNDYNAPVNKENRSIQENNNRAREMKPQPDREKRDKPVIERRNAPDPGYNDNRRQMDRNSQREQRMVEKNQQQQPYIQNRGNPGRETPQMKNSQRRQQPTNSSNEKNRGKKNGKG